jgi:N-acetyl-anhydromuramyl-L-alanine amidase AmpD
MQPQAQNNHSPVWRGSPNFWQGRNGHTPIAIVDHIIVGSLEGADSEFSNSANQVSAHYGVAKDGRIWQWVSTENAAWSNGYITKPDTSIGWLNQAAKDNVDPNYYTLSIEHEGKSGDAMPEAQYQATLWLHKLLIGMYKIIVDRQHIIGHYQLDSVTRLHCPGNGFPWGRLMQDLTSDPTPPKDHFAGIGQGAAAKLRQHGDTPTSPEIYLFNKDGSTYGSNTFFVSSSGQAGKVCWYKDTDVVSRYLFTD